MILKIKTKKLPENIHLGNAELVCGNSKYTSYRVALNDLTETLKVLNESGIYKVKILLDDQKDFLDDSDYDDEIVKTAEKLIADD